MVNVQMIQRRCHLISKKTSENDFSESHYNAKICRPIQEHWSWWSLEIS